MSLWLLWSAWLVCAVVAYGLFVTDLHLLSNAWSWTGGCVSVLLVQTYLERSRR